MFRTASVRAGIVVAVVAVAVVGLTGCQGTTSPAPTPVRSTDLTSSDGGFDEHAVIGVLLRADRSGSGSRALGSAFADTLTDAGFRPDVRIAARSDPAGSQGRALRALVRSGAKAVLVEAEAEDGDTDRLTDPVRYAHDAGVVVVALADPLPEADDPGDGGVSADYRVDGEGSADTLVERAVSVVESLQRGEKPDQG